MKIIYMISILMIANSINSAEIREYNVSMRDKSFISVCKHSYNSSLKTVSCESEYNTETLLIENGTLIQWKNVFSETRQFKAKVSGSEILTEGIAGDRSYKKSYPLNKDWIQSPPLMLTEFALSNRKKIKFYINTGPRLTTMQAKKIKREPLLLQGQIFDTQKIKITPTGIFSKFWTGELWIDLRSGHFVKYTSPLGPPGSPKMIFESKP